MKLSKNRKTTKLTPVLVRIMVVTKWNGKGVSRGAGRWISLAQGSRWHWDCDDRCSESYTHREVSHYLKFYSMKTGDNPVIIGRGAGRLSQETVCTKFREFPNMEFVLFSPVDSRSNTLLVLMCEDHT